ncbi:uncharacterized protein LOC132261831 [Phlebotomus argentipes]|uniref:uncharacterized protein LOC132261831 n=1 Tax=Phlebotomus argentipes TaxID=94469 RepID=UPI002892AACC|nr:uncharacterized protein LOC132261831 [Phlebotomus argentipes]
MLTLFDLPVEDIVAGCIAKYLTVHDIYNVWRCDGQFCVLAEKMLRQMENLNLRLLQGPCSDTFTYLIGKHCRSLKRFTTKKNDYLLGYFIEILENNPLLEELDLSFSKIGPKGPFKFQLRKLERLWMTDTILSKDFLEAISAHSHDLKILNISRITMTPFIVVNEFIKKVQSLTAIIAVRMDLIYDEDVQRGRVKPIMHSSSKLETLIISYKNTPHSRFLSPSGLVFEGKLKMPKLKRIIFEPGDSNKEIIQWDRESEGEFISRASSKSNLDQCISELSLMCTLKDA